MGRLLALLVLGSVVAEAEERCVRLDAEGVPQDFDIEAVAALLRLELGTQFLVASGRGPSSPSTIRIVPVEGQEAARWRVTLLEEVPSGRSAEVDLTDVPPRARARTLALAIGELTRGTTHPVPEASPAPGPRVAGDVAAGVRTFPGSATTFLDVRAAVTAPEIVGQWSPRLDVGLHYGRKEDPLGNVTVLVPTVGVGLPYSSQDERVRFELGPRLELGWATARAAANEDARSLDASGWVATAGLAGAASYRVTDRVGLEVALLLGHALRGLQFRAEDRLVIGLDGPMVGLTLGVEMGTGEK